MVKKKLVGLGGWLIFVQIGLILGVILDLVNMSDSFLTQNPFFGFLYLFFLLFGIFTLVLIYLRDKKFPVFAIISLWLPYLDMLLTLVLISIGHYFLEDAGFYVGYMTFAAIPAVIWTLYFLKSKRVKNTFTKERIKLK